VIPTRIQETFRLNIKGIERLLLFVIIKKIKRGLSMDLKATDVFILRDSFVSFEIAFSESDESKGLDTRFIEIERLQTARNGNYFRNLAYLKQPFGILSFLGLWKRLDLTLELRD
jgi:hypothetical protein